MPATRAFRLDYSGTGVSPVERTQDARAASWLPGATITVAFNLEKVAPP